jgi:hypothetical protein
MTKRHDQLATWSWAQIFGFRIQHPIYGKIFHLSLALLGGAIY